MSRIKGIKLRPVKSVYHKVWDVSPGYLLRLESSGLPLSFVPSIYMYLKFENWKALMAQL